VQAELDKLAEETEAEPPILWKKHAGGECTAEWGAIIAARVDHVDVRPVGRGGNRTPVHSESRFTGDLESRKARRGRGPDGAAGKLAEEGEDVRRKTRVSAHGDSGSSR
jgi:hypothetical protein